LSVLQAPPHRSQGAPGQVPGEHSTLLPRTTILRADEAELDVWLSGGGHPVVIHDEDTGSVSGVELEVKKSTLRELGGTRTWAPTR